MQRHTINRVDEGPAATPRQTLTRRQRIPRMAIGISGLMLFSLLGSSGIAFARVDAGLAEPSTGATTVTSTVTYQESSTRIAYNGHWASAAFSGYSGGRARSASQREAGATLTFTGKSVAWYGPVGPTRGSAKVYIDGTYIKTVSTYASGFIASKALFAKAFTTSGTHKLRIVALATSGHPTVAIDRFIVGSTSSR